MGLIVMFALVNDKFRILPSLRQSRKGSNSEQHLHPNFNQINSGHSAVYTNVLTIVFYH